MTRHGKNCTAGAVYTYHEKKKDTAASGYGTQSIRLGKDAIKDFDCCCLSLQPCQDPVVTPDGFLYEKQAILEYILHQKTETAKKMKAYEKQKQAQKSSSQLESKSEERERVERFKTRENSIVSKFINPFTSGQGKGSEKARTDSGSAESSTAASASTSSQSLPSFWIPSLTPESKPTQLKKPSKVVLCPMSGRPIKMNELITVRFTPLDPSLDRVALLTRQDRYVCAVTRDVLGNSVPCAVLRPSGTVVTQECVEKLIKKDMIDPISEDKLTDRDIIPLQRGGTGFAASGVDLSAKEARPVMQV
ncbi:nitric oxide synthase-interacting protein [Centropristis striata]|uniref:nitric oxide synthase-interacting protein n=1 Tax=Centropristis striata TaxID=184440 RepID=UPI0027E120CD|nr:nitric oxide synthase-interacting protein [Centropristis striata]XP_059203919.1 nitric oxide synthase-interacting protein [Centropristis striata]